LSDKGEIWRLVPSAPELMVSSNGRIMVVPHFAPGRGGKPRQYGGEPYFGVWSKQDARFIISFRGHSYKIARLVCEAFHGPAPFDGAVVMHIDENAANNRPSNLEWGTQKANLNAPGFIEYCKARTGENSPRAKWQKKRAA
jgi:hypothetical protein